ncbi:hypothetical protein AX768_30035 (plasmid) [Burkholderia sp. PAMC 28687]|nr:hypothetical protein AX768_30035 [Burkholderia sp. PAMC 28687]
MVQGGFDVDRVPKHDHIEHQAECAELVFLTLAVMLTQLAALAVKDGTCDAVATFAAVELRQRPPALRFVVDIGQSVQLPRELVEADIHAGRLQHLLPGLASTPGLVHAIFPTRRGMVPAVRHLLDALVAGCEGLNRQR